MLKNLYRKHFELLSPLSGEACVERLNDCIEGNGMVKGFVSGHELFLRFKNDSAFLSAKLLGDGDQTRFDCVTGTSLLSIIKPLFWFAAFGALAYGAASSGADFAAQGKMGFAHGLGGEALTALFWGAFAFCAFPLLITRKQEKYLRKLVESTIAEGAPPQHNPSAHGHKWTRAFAGMGWTGATAVIGCTGAWLAFLAVTLFEKGPVETTPYWAAGNMCRAPGYVGWLSPYFLYYYGSPLLCHAAWGSLEVFVATLAFLVIWRLATPIR